MDMEHQKGALEERPVPQTFGERAWLAFGGFVIRDLGAEEMLEPGVW
jgi:hypothetical protein